APVGNATYQHLVGNTAALPEVVTAIVVAGAAEELLYRGYVFERLRTLLGAGQPVLYTSIVVSAGVFAIAHYSDQGHLGVVQSAITGLVFATMFGWHGHIWTPIIAHITFNLTSVALIYGGWEEAVARALLR
ncbi:MAG: CPBP family intramembrane metalloprotease, partial [Gammaproteobacteria bacterium]|nr:CPBP family intramembrane metalloprotease [Gammaproteobacteria bacterium]